VVTITGRMLTIGGRQIETITIATPAQRRAFGLIDAPIPLTLDRDQRTRPMPRTLHNMGSRTSADVTPDWSAPGWRCTAPLV
jgi:hypothetical protein